MEIYNIVTLSLSGLLLLWGGGSRLANPKQACLKNSGIDLHNDVNLFNEMRGIGALMATGGVVALLGIVLGQLTIASFLVAITIFVGFAIGRATSTASDGKPNPKLAQGLIFEIVFGVANSVGLFFLLS